MEHPEKEKASHVFLRYVRRRWRVPVQAGAAGALLLGLLALAPLPFKTERVEAESTGAVTVGQVESLRTEGVGAPFQGSIQSVAVQPGQRVKKGDLLFKMDDTPLRESLVSAKQASADAYASLKEARARRDADVAALKQELSATRAQIRSLRAATQPQREVYPDGTVVETTYTVDPAQIESLTAYAQQLAAQIQERRSAWEPVIAQATASHRDAASHVRELEKQIAAADRRSPLNGVVTGIYADAGHSVAAGRAVVRVDDPTGYRVLTLVDERVREELKPGARLALTRGERQETGKLEKIESGWDKDLFRYWLWVKPANPAGLQPGEQVQVSIPPAGELKTASAG
ncbi:MAG: HlyD family secretion protein [Armatimonadota bacterium]